MEINKLRQQRRNDPKNGTADFQNIFKDLKRKNNFLQYKIGNIFSQEDNNEQK